MTYNLIAFPVDTRCKCCTGGLLSSYTNYVHLLIAACKARTQLTSWLSCKAAAVMTVQVIDNMMCVERILQMWTLFLDALVASVCICGLCWHQLSARHCCASQFASHPLTPPPPVFKLSTRVFDAIYY